MFELGTPRHLLDLGLRKAEAGDLEGARNDLVRAANSGDPETAPRAANALGRLVADSDPALAEEAFRTAISFEEPEQGSRAAFALASLYQRHGNQAGALQLYELATRSPDPGLAASAREAVQAMGDVHNELTAEMSPAEVAFTEGVRLRESGDLAGAVSAFTRCMASGDAEYAPYAGCQLGAILAAEGDFENARSPLWSAVRSRHPTYAPMAAYVLAEILLEEGDRTAAREVLPLATQHPDQETARRACTILARLR